MATDNRVKLWRQKRGLTQRELGKAAKITQQMVQRVETGITPARVEVAVRLSGALEVPLVELFPKLRKAIKGLPGTLRIDDPRAEKALGDAGLVTEVGYTLFKYR